METIPGHKIELKRLDGWEADYGGSSRPVMKPWVVCECGFRRQILAAVYPGEENSRAQSYMDQHYIDVLVSKVFGGN